MTRGSSIANGRTDLSRAKQQYANASALDLDRVVEALGRLAPISQFLEIVRTTP